MLPIGDDYYCPGFILTVPLTSVGFFFKEDLTESAARLLTLGVMAHCRIRSHGKRTHLETQSREGATQGTYLHANGFKGTVAGDFYSNIFA